MPKAARALGISLLCLLGVLLAMPSLLPSSVTDRLPAALSPKVNLGLDLAGGSHIMLEADVNDVRLQRLDSMEKSIREAMRGESGAADDISIGQLTRTSNSVSFLVRDASKIDEVRERLNTLTTGASLTGERTWNIEIRDTNRVVMTQTQAGLNQFIEQAIGRIDTGLDTALQQHFWMAPELLMALRYLRDPQAVQR